MVPNAGKEQIREKTQKKCNVTESMCHAEHNGSLNDISNVRCHG